MNCIDCPHFHIMCDPIKASGGGYWDSGLARCRKYDVVADWTSKAQLKKLKCVEEEKA